MKQPYSIVHDLAAFSTIGLVTASWASTTQSTVVSLSAIRLVFILIVLLSLVWGIAKFPSKTGTILAGSGILVLFAYYSLLMLGIVAPTSASSVTSHITWVIVSVSIAGNYYLTPSGKPIVSDRVAWMFISFAFAILFYTVTQGGLLISGFPQFVFELETSEGSSISYSQGISKFFGLAAVFSAALISNSVSKLHLRYFCMGSLVVFLILSLIGGGRGDFVLALLTSIVVLGKFYAAVFVSTLTLMGMVYASAIEELLSAYSILAERFFALSYSLGMRDTLIADSLNLLLDNPVCMAFGCGIGFFQSYYDYPASLYPHNVLLETLISFGLIPTFALAFIALSGRSRMREFHGKSPNFVAMIVFFLLISFKSGSLLTSFLLWGGLIFLVLHGIARLQGTRESQNKCLTPKNK